MGVLTALDEFCQKAFEHFITHKKEWADIENFGGKPIKMSAALFSEVRDLNSQQTGNRQRGKIDDAGLFCIKLTSHEAARRRKRVIKKGVLK